MCDLDHVDRTDLGEPGDPPLLLGAEVAEEHRRHGPANRIRGRIDPEHEARGVARPVRRRFRPIDPPTRGVEHPVLAALGPADGGPGRGQPIQQRVIAGAGRRPDQHRVDGTQHRVDPADMIEVVVREDQQVDAAHAESAEAVPQRRRVGTDVDQGDGPRLAPQHRIPLPDVACGDPPIGRNGTGTEDGSGDGGRAAHDETQDQRAGTDASREAPTRRSRQEQQYGESQRRQEQDPREPRQPRDARTRPRLGGPRDTRDPPRRHGGHRDRDVRRGRPDRNHQAADQTDTRSDGGGGFGQEIRDDAVERQTRIDEHDRRLTGQLRRSRHRQGEGEWARHNAGEPIRDRLREQEQSGRRQHREHEAEPGRDRRIRDHEHNDGEPERRRRCSVAIQESCEQHHGRHHRGSYHAGLGRHQQHKTREGRERDERSQPHPGPEQGGEQEGGRHHDGAVGAGDRGEMGERGRPHRLLQRRIEPRRVADRKAGEQSSRVALDRGAAVEEAEAQSVGRRCERWSIPHDARLLARLQQRCGGDRYLRVADPPGDLRLGPDRQPRRRRGREHAHRSRESGRPIQRPQCRVEPDRLTAPRSAGRAHRMRARLHRDRRRHERCRFDGARHGGRMQHRRPHHRGGRGEPGRRERDHTDRE